MVGAGLAPQQAAGGVDDSARDCASQGLTCSRRAAGHQLVGDVKTSDLDIHHLDVLIWNIKSDVKTSDLWPTKCHRGRGKTACGRNIEK